MKWIKRVCNVAFFFLAMNLLEHFCHEKTEGFTLSRIQFKHQPTTQENPDPKILALLNQPFHYMSSGDQSFVFLSEDGQYVLKFFKYANNSFTEALSRVKLLNRCKAFRPKRQRIIAWKRDRDFQSYTLAFDHLQSETGIVHLHLKPTENIYPTISLEDPLHILHTLDLNQTPFVLQKRATPVYAQLTQWINNKETDKLQKGIHDLFSLCQKRQALNITDDDVHFYSNFGFVGDTPIQIDPGHFTVNTTPPPLSELQTLSYELQTWFQDNHPEYLPYVEKY